MLQSITFADFADLTVAAIFGLQSNLRPAVASHALTLWSRSLPSRRQPPHHPARTILLLAPCACCARHRGSAGGGHECMRPRARFPRGTASCQAEQRVPVGVAVGLNIRVVGSSAAVKSRLLVCRGHSWSAASKPTHALPSTHSSGARDSPPQTASPTLSVSVAIRRSGTLRLHRCLARQLPQHAFPAHIRQGLQTDSSCLRAARLRRRSCR
eukprot:361082-Chlamydomonas_euryale.AAC.27